MLIYYQSKFKKLSKEIAEKFITKEIANEVEKLFGCKLSEEQRKWLYESAIEDEICWQESDTKQDFFLLDTAIVMSDVLEFNELIENASEYGFPMNFVRPISYKWYEKEREQFI